MFKLSTYYPTTVANYLSTNNVTVSSLQSLSNITATVAELKSTKSI